MEVLPQGLEAWKAGAESVAGVLQAKRYHGRCVDGDLGAGEVASRRPPREAGPVNKPVNLAKQASLAADIGWVSNT
jgi:hypothetical protein